MTSIHISDIRTFRSCRRKWEWSSPLKQNLEPQVPYIPFFTGKALHAALEYYYRDAVPFNETVDKYLASEEANMEELTQLWDSEKESFEEQVELIRDMIDHYAMWQLQDTRKYADRNLEFIALEQGFEIPLPGMPADVTLGGRFDGVVRHRETGEYWIWETKTSRSILELTKSLSNDEQCGVYMYAASQMLDVPIAGVLYNIIRKKAPTIPNTLQSGAISKAKNIDTTSFVYRSTILEHFPDWSEETIQEEYGDILRTLLDNDSKYFLRYPVYRSKTELKNLMENVLATAKEMVNPDLALYPAPSWNSCSFCQFRSPCLAKNAGGDFQVLLDGEYVHRKHNISMRPDGTPEE